MSLFPTSELLLTNNQTLEELELYGCGLDDDAMCSLARGLKHCKLKKLNLSGNPFTKRGASELYEVLKGHPTLKKEVVEMLSLPPLPWL